MTHGGVMVTWFSSPSRECSRAPLCSLCQPLPFSCPLMCPYRCHPSLPVNPSSPSRSTSPFLNASSHSVPVFVEEPVKVALAAVQTPMAPRCVWKNPPPPQVPSGFCVGFYHKLTTRRCPLLSPWHQGVKGQKRKTEEEDGWNMWKGKESRALGTTARLGNEAERKVDE